MGHRTDEKRYANARLECCPGLRRDLGVPLDGLDALEGGADLRALPRRRGNGAEADRGATATRAR